MNLLWKDWFLKITGVKKHLNGIDLVCNEEFGQKFYHHTQKCLTLKSKSDKKKLFLYGDLSLWFW